MKIRKVVRIANSRLVTLPKDWAPKAEYVIVSKEDRLVIIPLREVDEK